MQSSSTLSPIFNLPEAILLNELFKYLDIQTIGRLAQASKKGGELAKIMLKQVLEGLRKEEKDKLFIHFLDGLEKFGKAIKEDSMLELIQLFHVIHTDIDLKNKEAKTVLHYAAQHGYLKAAESLIENKAKVNEIDTNGMAPLHHAVKNGFLEVAALLIGNGAQVDLVDMKGMAPLHHAVSNGHKEIVELLLAKDPAIIQVSNKRARNVLHCAIEGGSDEIIELLIKKDAPLDSVDVLWGTPLQMRLSKITSVDQADSPFFDPIIYLLLKAGVNSEPGEIKRNSENCEVLFCAALAEIKRLASELSNPVRKGRETFLQELQQQANEMLASFLKTKEGAPPKTKKEVQALTKKMQQVVTAYREESAIDKVIQKHQETIDNGSLFVWRKINAAYEKKITPQQLDVVLMVCETLTKLSQYSTFILSKQDKAKWKSALAGCESVFSKDPWKSVVLLKKQLAGFLEEAMVGKIIFSSRRDRDDAKKAESFFSEVIKNLDTLKPPVGWSAAESDLTYFQAEKAFAEAQYEAVTVQIVGELHYPGETPSLWKGLAELKEMLKGESNVGCVKTIPGKMKDIFVTTSALEKEKYGFFAKLFRSRADNQFLEALKSGWQKLVDAKHPPALSLSNKLSQLLREINQLKKSDQQNDPRNAAIDALITKAKEVENTYDGQTKNSLHEVNDLIKHLNHYKQVSKLYSLDESSLSKEHKVRLINAYKNIFAQAYQGKLSIVELKQRLEMFSTVNALYKTLSQALKKMTYTAVTVCDEDRRRHYPLSTYLSQKLEDCISSLEKPEKGAANCLKQIKAIEDKLKLYPTGRLYGLLFADANGRKFQSEIRGLQNDIKQAINSAGKRIK